MADSRFRIRPGIRHEWIRDRQATFPPDGGRNRAGVAGAYLPPGRLHVPHQVQASISESVPCCVAMVLRSYGLDAEADRLAWVLSGGDPEGASGRSLRWLRAWGVTAECPDDLQFFRDGTIDLNHRLGTPQARLVFRWEERWLRFVRKALQEGIPPILFVDLGRLSPAWRGLHQRHAVVLSGGDGRQAWINDPARTEGPVRVGLSKLMDSLLPGEPLAALLRCDPRLFGTPAPDGDADAGGVAES
ncbi:MAG: hypothetical protein K0Q72_1192 [Armatimonadetes bacterium]|jgi:hypothetical protein|nr:hypothetical protein [Armatimonadota bacterium]